MTAALEVERFSVRYGGVCAVDEIDLEVGDSQIVGLIGPNGAGKTSFVDAVTGFTPYSGTVRLAGRSVDGLSPHRRCRAGLARTFQQGELFADLSVRENVQVVATQPGRDRTVDSPAAPGGTILTTFGLDDVADRRPDELPQGRRGLVGIARALATRPSVLVLDEPAAGLDQIESRHLGELLRDLARAGLPILLIDHDMDLVMSVCDHVYALDFGKRVASGAPAEIVRNSALIRAYLGDYHDDGGASR